MSLDNDEELLPRPVLDAWEVPAPPSDLEDAIMKGIDMTRAGKSSVAERTATTLIVPILAGLAAAALVLVWLATTRERPDAHQAPAPVAAPAPTPTAPPEPEKPETAATLVIDVGPVSAEVVVDGKALEGPAPFIVTALPTGKHKLKVDAPDHLPIERTLDLPAGTTEIPIKLAAKFVTLSVDVTPRTAALTLVTESDGEATRTDVGPVIELTRTPSARYLVSASARGYQTRELRVGFDGSPVQRMAIALPRDPDAPAPATTKKRSASPPVASPPPAPAVGQATLRIGTNIGAPPARVHVDGKMIGMTPQPDVRVTAGRHTVKWTWPSGKTSSRSVVLNADTVKVVKAG